MINGNGCAFQNLLNIVSIVSATVSGNGLDARKGVEQINGSVSFVLEHLVATVKIKIV